MVDNGAMLLLWAEHHDVSIRFRPDAMPRCGLAQRPGSYVILEYHRPVLKRRDTEQVITTPAPPKVERSVADVSFLAGLLVDKFLYHLPLYRQHQRLLRVGSS
jgi:transposase